MDKPEFDFDLVGRKWEKAFSETIMQATRAQMTFHIPQPENGDLTDYAEKKISATEVIEAMGARQEALLCEVLVSVPRDWLVSDAPESIDWHEVASLDYLKRGKYAELLQLLQGGAVQSAKN